MRWYARFFEGHRGLVAAFVLAVTALAALGLSRLRFDDVPRGIFVTDSVEHVLLEELYAEFGSDDNDALLVLEADDWLRPERAELLARLRRRALAIEGVEAFVGLADVPVLNEGLPHALLPAPDAPAAAWERAREAARTHPLVHGRLLSDDGRTCLAVVQLAGDALSVEEMERPVAALRALARELSDPEAGLTIRVTGVPPVRVDIYDTIEREQVRFLLLGAALCSVLALFLFQSLGAVVVAVAGPILGTLWAFGWLGLFGVRIDLIGASLPLICIVIGFTDSVHLVVHARERRGAGASPLEAAVSSIAQLGMPCLLTSLTTAVGFASLLVGRAATIRHFGGMAAFAVLASFVAVLTVMPLGASWIASIGASRHSPFLERWRERFGRLVDLLTARHLPVSLAAVLVTGLLFLVATRLVPENRLLEATVVESEAHQALLALEDAFGGVLPAYVVLDWEPDALASEALVVDALEALEAGLERVPRVGQVSSALSFLRLLPGRPRSLAALAVFPPELRRRFVGEPAPSAASGAAPAPADHGDADGGAPRLRSRALVSFGVPDGSTAEMRAIYAAVDALLADVHERFPAFTLRLSGTDVVARRAINEMIVGLAESLFFAAVVIFGVLALELRSLSLGLVSLIPNLFPLALTGAFLVATGRPLQLSSAVVFSVLLGLAVDDTIHFLSRYRRELALSGERDLPAVRVALRKSFVAVGTPVLITTAVLFLGFAIALTSAIPTSRLVALLLCIGILAALVGDLFFLPALVALRARWRDRRGHGGRAHRAAGR